MTFSLVDMGAGGDASEKFLGLVRLVRPPMIVLDEDYVTYGAVCGSVFFTPIQETSMIGAEMYNMRRMMDDGIEDLATGSAACILAYWTTLQRDGLNRRASFEFH
jgi:predicted PhzF superfamily epimerase YddE/YHI9